MLDSNFNLLTLLLLENGKDFFKLYLDVKLQILKENRFYNLISPHNPTNILYST